MTATKGRIEDIMGSSDYTFLSTDSQHGPFSEQLLIEFCDAAAQVGVPVVFRIKHTFHSYLVGNILDLGPSGIEVPQTETAETAQEALDYFYYPQVGGRSWGGAARYGVEGRGDRLEYADWWNANGILCMQIETLRAVTNIRQLAKPGVTCLTWGPADLNFDIEAHPHHPLQTVDDCVRHALEQLEGTDTKINFRNYTPDLRDHYAEMGVTVFMERPR